MKYELLAINIPNKERDVENVALIKRGNTRKEYAVVKNLDVHRDMNNDDCWDWTIEYYEDSIYGMQKAIECYRIKTEENYISRSRLEEIATKFKDACFEIGEIEEIEESTIGETLILNVELTENEIEFFCIPKDAIEEYNTTKSVVDEFTSSKEKKYYISFINGNNLSYASTTIKAKNEEDAIEKLYEKYGNFDHEIILCQEINKEV